MMITLDTANAALRDAVTERLDARRSRETVNEGSSHATSQRFYDLCDALKEMHRRKSADYGSAVDPLANIRNGAEFVGIEPWRAAMVRLSDKVTRLQTYCRTGSLTFENFEDTCFDLASYALLTMMMHQESST
jgi:hypothetical protein